MNICEPNTVEKIPPHLIAGHLYQNTLTQRLYIYCKGKDTFINLAQGSFYDESTSFVSELVDVTDQYCITKV